MINVLIFVIIYLGYVFIWSVINLVAYFLSILFKKRISDALVSIATIVATILNAILGLWLFWYTITLLLSGQIFLFFIFLFIGYSLITSIFGILQSPILIIPVYFSEKLATIDLNDEVITAEIIDENNNIVETVEGDITIKRKFAKYFIFLYSSLLFYMLFFPAEREVATLGDYIVRPFLQMITTTLFIGLFYSIYYKFKYGHFFPEDKRNFFAQVWKIGFIFIVVGGVALFFLAIITNTY